MQMDLVIGNRHITTVTRPKILGATFNNMLTLCAHGKAVQNKMPSRTKIRKSLGESIAPIWSSQHNTSSWNNIQRAQNAALRTIRGCHFMSHQDDLHRETNIIPTKDHNAMLSKQYTLPSHLPCHPSYSLVNQGPPERNLRKYAGREYKENKESFMLRGGLNQANLKLGMKSSAINPITVTRPPPIKGRNINYLE